MTMNQERLLSGRQLEDEVEDEGSEFEHGSDSDDSENDPSFSIRDDSSTKISHRSIKKKSRNLINLESESERDEDEVSVQKLDANDEKSFELVEKVIEAGQIEKLKVEQCKVYLRKNGLRLTGNKDTLIQRIKEHQEILNGGGEKKYPQSSFVLNCKGDACMGDVVMFEQNVYEMFNLASRSASGPPCGTRIVVGRIVKESYGAAKQQHTFTRWEDEGQREKALMEKHSRGSLARSDRDARMEEKKMRKMLNGTKISRKSVPKKKQSQPIQSQHQPTGCLAKQSQQSSSFAKSKSITQPQHAGFAVATEHQRQDNQMRQMDVQRRCSSCIQEVHHRRSFECHPNYNLQQDLVNKYPPNGSSLKASHVQPLRSNNHMNPPQRQMDMYCSSIQEFHHRRSFECHPSYNLQQNHARPQDHVSRVMNKYHQNGSSHVQPLGSNNHMKPPQRQGQGHTLRQPCRHYAQGRCHFGENCKYLHESKDEYPQRREEAWRPY